MNESTKKINEMIKTFNETFDISPNINGEEVNQLVINNLKNNGSEFVGLLFDIFGQIIASSDSEYELIYLEGKGLAIGKKVVKTEYILED